MTKRKASFHNLSSHYLFPEINRRKRLYLERFPDAPLISLGIGDTTEPLPHLIAEGLAKGASALGTHEGYSGYGPEQGDKDLRGDIAAIFYPRDTVHDAIGEDDIFISDGSKCDIGRLQQLFGSDVSIIVQDPAYPVYVDGSVIEGVTDIRYVGCCPENGFWPDWSRVARADLIYWCSPNNPTGTVSTRQQLEELVAFAKSNRSIILFDAAYSSYIQDPTLPRSIFEIEGADEVAIELNSFSKLAGFTGVRLGWTVVPKALKYEDGSSVQADWKRLVSTIFNGASNIAQKGGRAVLSPEGIEPVLATLKHYLHNVSLLKQGLTRLGYQCYGGDHAPYLWIKIPGMTSWEAFQMFLEKWNLVVTPGSGFGPKGESFIRMSAFNSTENIKEAIKRVSHL